ncbi:PREDICTED: uncharacterized protein LOC108774161 isoform X1 [Cyphomyrmex costatus]|uniref:uncharacterized protein LOC108774161 isoform X1 n=1 Tax=Cyphomyrmex costatus TaxID=456900 RepID=UPI000852202D|nr:PREDICTED: uncharacterized protein LOC108774161 isoform X1 [Cyphomyrmex costatus]
MCRIYSTLNYPNNKNYKTIDRIYKIKYIKDIIQDLESYGPAGLIHIAFLSNIIQRPIRIWNANGNLNKIIGKKKTGQPVDIEYHAINLEEIGHWTLRGGKDPDNVISDLNSCLFSAIGSQIGQNPLRLRKWTQLKLKVNFQNLIKWIDKILQLEGSNKRILMIGGARYIGKTIEDAKAILDKSQRAEGYNQYSSKLGACLTLQTVET